MRIAPYLAIARLAVGMQYTSLAIEKDLIEAFRAEVEKKPAKPVKEQPKRVYLNYIPVPSPDAKEVLNCREGQKLEAVKSYKGRTGLSLLDSKRIIEAYGVHLGIYPANSVLQYGDYIQIK
jgi:ribosomal protein L7/L12